MNLNTIENFLLIAHHPVKGRFRISDLHLHYGIVGAILLELTLDNHLELKNKNLTVSNDRQFEHDILTEVSETIRTAKRPRRIRYWVSKLERCSRKYKWSFIEGMEQKGLIRIEKKKFIGLFSYRKTFLSNYQAREELLLKLKDCAIQQKDLTLNNIFVLSLVEACKMHRIITTDKQELKKLKKELKIIIKECPIAEVVDKTIREVQAAIIAVIAASSAASAAASSS